jgi:predicted transcriptional regulator|tara:strand:+ start:1252 stop:1434 length:183 start_codon:yes stop_codon:yes gene_type:complete
MHIDAQQLGVNTMSLPAQVQSMLEDWFEDEVERLLLEGYDASVAAEMAEQNTWEWFNERE